MFVTILGPLAPAPRHGLAFWEQAFVGPLQILQRDDTLLRLANTATGAVTEIRGRDLDSAQDGLITGWQTFDAEGLPLVEVRNPTGPLLDWQPFAAINAALTAGDAAPLRGFLSDTATSVDARLAPGPLEMTGFAGVTASVFVQGSDFGDRIRASDRNATLIGRQGDDHLTTGMGRENWNTVWAGPGNDTVISGTGTDEVSAGPGDDLVDGRLAWVASRFWGGDGNDTLLGPAVGGELGGGAGNDLIDARAGGVNRLWGGVGNDTIHGAGEGDRIGGGTGDDLIHAGRGADVLYLGAGNDQADGGAGNDTLFAGPGFDRMWGGDGADRFEFYRNNGWNRIEDFEAADVLALAPGLWTAMQGSLAAEQVVSRFGRLTGNGDVMLGFDTGTAILLVGVGTLDGLADQIILL
jgi:Ca2+-binding RTX toxin-like protein